MNKKNFNHEIEYRGKKVLDSFNKHIIICGCGAIGSNLAENLVRQGFTNFTFIDFDRVEESNIGTQSYTTYDIGGMKVAALSARIYDIAEVDSKTFNKRLTSDNIKKFLSGADLIVDAFDNGESRKLLKEYGDKHNIPVLHGGLFEDYGEVVWNKKYKVPIIKEGLDICDYPLARNIIVLLTVVMTEEIIKWCTDHTLNDWSITLKDLKIRKL